MFYTGVRVLRVWLKSGDGPAAEVRSPADLAGKSGTVRVQADGDVSERVRMHWAIALGLFAARGGDVRWI